jgi:hypothetical protein
MARSFPPLTLALVLLTAGLPARSAPAAVQPDAPDRGGATSTVTTLSLSVNPVVYGQNVTLTATVVTSPPSESVPTGSVQFGSIGTPITLDGSGQATLTTNTLPAQGAPYSISAVYTSNSSSFAGSSSSASNLSVLQASTATTLSSSANPSVSGQSVTFTVTVAAVFPSTAVPAGEVQLFVNDASLGSAVALNGSGQATFAIDDGLSLGLNFVKVEYAASDGDFNTSFSPTLNQVVNISNSNVYWSDTSTGTG